MIGVAQNFRLVVVGGAGSGAGGGVGGMIDGKAGGVVVGGGNGWEFGGSGFVGEPAQGCGAICGGAIGDETFGDGSRELDDVGDNDVALSRKLSICSVFTLTLS